MSTWTTSQTTWTNKNFYNHSTPSSPLYNVHLNNKRYNLKRSPSLWRGRAASRFRVHSDVEANHLQMCPPSQIFKCVQWTLFALIIFSICLLSQNATKIYSYSFLYGWVWYRLMQLVETSPHIVESLDLVWLLISHIKDSTWTVFFASVRLVQVDPSCLVLINCRRCNRKTTA